MNILERYIGKAVLVGSIIVMLVLLTLLGVFELVKELDDVGVGSYTTSDAMVSALLTLPRKLFEVFPVTALVGSLLGLGTLASNGELTAMRAAGVSVHSIVIAVLKTGFFMLVFVFLIGEFVGPVSESYVRKVKVEKQQQAITLKSKHGFWARDGNEYVNIRKILPGSQLEDIYIYEVDADKQLKLATHARSATYVDGKWTLQGIEQTSLQQEPIRSRSVGSASWGSMIDPDLLSIIVVEPAMLPAWGLYNYMSFMKQNGQDATLYQVAFWTKIVTPLTTVVMLFLAVPFVLGSLREVGVGQRVFVGTLIGTVFYALNQSFSYMSIIYNLEPALATSLPALVMFFAGLWYLRRID
ncbi:MAG: LPS export ABC transporter permease LptG [Chromatiales bacterium]|jgi:lipopolysaccharide export system permease protein